jgi:hypothetical protein
VICGAGGGLALAAEAVVAAVIKAAPAAGEILLGISNLFSQAPNPGGRLGGPEHRAKVRQRAKELEDQGHEVEAGGGKLPERAVGEPGQKRFPDITTKDPSGKPYFENVGKTTKSGQPVARERRALQDIEGATRTKPGFTPIE